MTTLDYPGQPPRVTDDAEIIATLTRKGWAVRPDPPAYDPQTHQCAWDGAQWVVSALPPPPVPQSVESHKIKIALTMLGWRAEIEELVATSSQSIKDAWTAPYMSRDSVLLNQCAMVLEKAGAQVDDLFRMADALVT